MGDIAQRGNRLTAAKGGRIGKFGGGRTNLLEELGRVEAEPSNRNRRAEISRVHGELNRGYREGGEVRKSEKRYNKSTDPEYIKHVNPGKPKGIGTPKYKGGPKGGKKLKFGSMITDTKNPQYLNPFKKGGKADKKWIQKAVNPKHKGYCTPMTKKTCTPARKALARTFKKKAKTGWG